MTKTSDLNRMKDTAKLLKEQAGRVYHHVLSRRVTHTISSLKRLIALMTEIQKGLQDNKDYFKQFEFGMYQCQIGATEIRLEKNKKHIFIQGTFDIEMLKEFFVVNEPEGMTTITVEGPNVKVKKEFDHFGTLPDDMD